MPWPRTPLSSRVATRVSWSPLSGLKGVQPPLPFGEMQEESEKVGLKLNIQKTKIMASGPITSWQINGETMETVTGFIFGDSKISADGDSSHEIKRRLLLGRKAIETRVTKTPGETFVSSVQFSCSVVSESLGPRGLKDARLPCPSPAPGACSNSCPSSQ